MYLNKPIAYLQNNDINKDGEINTKNNKPIFIMIQSNFCGHCTHAKPDFQKIANDMHDKIFFATIQGDGKEKDEPVDNKKFDVMTNGKFVGFPTYVLYKNRQYINYEGGRDYNSIKNFLQNNI